MSITSKPDWGDTLVSKAGVAHPSFQEYLDEISQLLNDHLLGKQVTLPSYTVATLPPVTSQPGMIFVSDESGGAVPAFSDGTNWRRVTDRAVIT